MADFQPGRVDFLSGRAAQGRAKGGQRESKETPGHQKERKNVSKGCFFEHFRLKKGSQIAFSANLQRNAEIAKFIVSLKQNH